MTRSDSPPQPSDPAREQRRRLKGIALMTGAVAGFSCIDASAKFLINHMDIAQVVWARYAFAFIFSLFISNPFTHPALMRTSRPWLQIGRSALLVLSTALNVVALRYLQLDQTVSIMFSTPFLVAILSGPLLGEWVGWRRWTAIIVGFIGVLVVIRPGMGGGMQWAALFSVGAAIFYAAYSIATRMVSRTDSSETTLFYGNLVAVCVMAPLLPFVWKGPLSLLDFGLLVAVGALGSSGHYLMIAAHRRAPASVLSPFMYTQLVWATTLGFLVFGDIPTQWTMVGATIVVASGLYLLYRERKVTGRVAPVEPG